MENCNEIVENFGCYENTKAQREINRMLPKLTGISYMRLSSNKLFMASFPQTPSVWISEGEPAYYNSRINNIN
jgi:hypothetical protein